MNMQKKVLIISVCLLVVTLLTVACNKKEEKEPEKNYVPIDYTVGEDGEKYITNVYGDLIPVTTSKDGSMELMEDLLTKTKEQAEKEEQEKPKDSEGGAEQPNDQPNDTPNEKPNENPNDKPNGIQVGTDDIRNNTDKDAVIVW